MKLSSLSPSIPTNPLISIVRNFVFVLSWNIDTMRISKHAYMGLYKSGILICHMFTLVVGTFVQKLKQIYEIKYESYLAGCQIYMTVFRPENILKNQNVMNLSIY